jgi:putative nucleotidyltransferase with HDIG domain
MNTSHERNGEGAGAANGNGAVPEEVDRDRLKVLLVDDHVSVLRFLSLAFSSKGCDVATAGRAEEAFELIGKQSFDLVVSDIKMPGLSGLDVLRAVKGRQPETPVVLITGAPSVESAVFGVRHQAFDYLTKPFSADEVPQLLERVRKDRRSRTQVEKAPVALTAEIRRRQVGVEGLSRIGALALEDLDSAALVERVLEHAMAGLGGDAAVITLSDADGNLTPSHKGNPDLAAHLVTLSRSALGTRQPADAEHCLFLAGPSDPLSAVGAFIQGVESPTGILCVARGKDREFLPDETSLLLAYAGSITGSLQKVVLRETIEQNLIDTISSFVTALESKDLYLKGHSARVSLYAGEIAKSLGLPRSEIAVARRAGILHDLGKIVVMDAILQKPGRLTPEEFAHMKGHPLNAAKILKPLRFLSEESEAIKRHHERYDGKGYPDGLVGDQIPLAARIITVADSFDAMTSNRPYRDAMPIETALGELRRHAGAQFDPKVTEAFAGVGLARLAEINRFENASPSPPVEAAAPRAGTVRRPVGSPA